MPATVRPATPADVPALGRLGALLAARDALVLVAEAEGAVVGYAYAGVEGRDYMARRGPAGVLHDIVVDPAHRGRGAPRVVLSTADRNATAQRLCAHAGFRRTMIERRELDD